MRHRDGGGSGRRARAVRAVAGVTLDTYERSSNVAPTSPLVRPKTASPPLSRTAYREAALSVLVFRIW
jgi:hypothetical protein